MKMSDMRADLDCALAGVRLSEKRKAAILAAAKGADEMSRKRRSFRTALAAAALCAVLAVTALAASPTVRERLEALLGSFAPYSQEVAGVTATDQGIQVTVLRAVGDGEEGWCYLEIRDLEGDRLTEDTYLGGWAQAESYDPETGILLARADLRGAQHNADGTVTFTVDEVWGGETFSGVALPLELLEPDNVLRSCPSDPMPDHAAPSDGNTALVPGQTAMALEGTDLFTLSSAGFDGAGHFHIQIALARGTQVPVWEFYPRSLMTADLPCAYRNGQSSQLEGGRYVDFQMCCYADMGGETVLTKEAYAAVEELTLEGWIGTRERVEGEWTLTFSLEPMTRRTVAVDQPVNGLTVDQVTLSNLSLRLDGTFPEDIHGSLGAMPLSVFLADGSTVTVPRGRVVAIDHPVHDPGDRSFVNLWSFDEPIEPEQVVGFAVGHWYMPLDGNTAQPGQWLDALPGTGT